jgi:hypothetical protein
MNVHTIDGDSETIGIEKAGTMPKVIQRRSMAIELFSNALFCLWLSTACLVVWVDLGAGPATPAAQGISTVSRPAATAAAPDGRAATPASDGGADAA